MTEQEIKNQIEQHRKAGDLIDCAAKIRVQDGKDVLKKLKIFLIFQKMRKKN